MITVVRTDITTLKVDASVNAANEAIVAYVFRDETAKRHAAYLQ